MPEKPFSPAQDLPEDYPFPQFRTADGTFDVEAYLEEGRQAAQLLWKEEENELAELIEREWVDAAITYVLADRREQRERVRIDKRTELLNDVAFEEELVRMGAQAERNGTLLLVGAYDIAGIKAHNEDHENFGPWAGDTMIEFFAERLKETFRVEDRLFRRSSGADEFYSLSLETPGTSEKSHSRKIEVLKERLARTVAETPCVAVEPETGRRVTLPLEFTGAFTYYVPSSDGKRVPAEIQMMMRQRVAVADQILYAAKADRNRAMTGL